jgi:hypothetical protein
MGVYLKGELKKLSLDSLIKVRKIHEKDLVKYHTSEAYPNRERDIEVTKQNIPLLDNEIQAKSRQCTFRTKYTG